MVLYKDCIAPNVICGKTCQRSTWSCKQSPAHYQPSQKNPGPPLNCRKGKLCRGYKSCIPKGKKCKAVPLRQFSKQSVWVSVR